LTVADSKDIPLSSDPKGFVLQRKNLFASLLAVIYQEVVVHSIENCEAGVAKQQLEQETEWTITIMPD